MKKHFYHKLWFKNTILITIPAIIAFLSLIISLSSNDVLNAIFVATCFFLTICFIFAVVIFSNQDEKINQEYEKLANEKIELANILAHMENNYKTSIYTISTFSSLAEKWAKNINSFATNVKNNGTVSDKAWNKIKLMDSICSHCKKMIEQYCNNYDDSKISVGFISYRKDDNNEEWVHMVAHSNPNSSRPNSCKEECKLSECLYHYGDLIKDKITDIEVARNNEEILRIFHNVSRGNQLDKYTQYIAIPVYCTSNRLLGIFQVVTKYNYYIEIEKIDLIRFATSNIIPYANLIVLIDKIYKGLYVSPSRINKEE